MDNPKVFFAVLWTTITLPILGVVMYFAHQVQPVTVVQTKEVKVVVTPTTEPTATPSAKPTFSVKKTVPVVTGGVRK